MLRLLIPRPWRDVVLRDLEDEARARGKGRMWVAAQTIGVGLRLQPVINGDTFMTDLRYVLRSLWRAKGFAIGAAAVFFVGIGINLATFSVVDRILFRSLPFAESERLVLLRACNLKTGACGGGFPSAVLKEGGALKTVGPMAVVGFAEPYRVNGASDEVPPLWLHQTSMGLLSILGVAPVVGRDVTEEETRQDRRVALLSYETWQSKFGGAQDVLTKELRTSTGVVPIIGVLPCGFVAPSWAMASAAWDGLAMFSSPQTVAPVARLAPGATTDQATAEIGALIAALGPRVRGPRDRPDTPLPFVRVEPLEATLFERSARQASLIAVAAGLVLLLACANLAGLILARGRVRERDMALRTALGASRARIISTTVMETGLVCALGASAAVLASLWTADVLRTVLPPLMARYAAAATDSRTVAVTLVASVLCSLIAGGWAGLRAARVRPTDALLTASGSGGRRKLAGGSTLLAVEAALGVVLVFGAAGTLRSFANLLDEGVGLDPRGLYTVNVQAAPSATPAARPSPQDSLARYEQSLLESVGLPGVIAVAGGDSIVGSGATAMRGFSTDRNIRGGRFEVSGGYFAALRSPLLAGREFTLDEVSTRAPVALLNPAALSEVWPDLSADQAIGRTITLADDVPRTVVGIVPALRDLYGEAVRPAMFVPLGTQPAFYSSWLVRMADDSPETAATYRQALSSRTASRVRLTPLVEGLDRSLREPRFRAMLFTAFAVCGLLIAGTGILALTLFNVALRRQEMGVRLTLGAAPGDLVRLVIREALVPVAIGTAVGVVATYWAGKALQTFLYETDARDPWTLALVVSVLLATAVIAAWIPARRASRVDPAVVLRSQ
ncbi:MAG: ABC transporter permease [Acidobacteria bacterium]|nr:ABC transporter permease [Acidobacteriota bacterium]